MNKLLILLLLVLSFQFALAQAPARSPLAEVSTHYTAAIDKDNGKVTGSVADAKTKEAIPYATIAMVDPATGTPVDGTLADGGGKFSMDKVKHGEYNIQVSFIGYEIKTINNVKIGDKKVDLGQILLSESEETLEEVTIEGQRAMIEEKVDRTVYNAEQDASNKGGDAADVLRKVPMLTVDLDGNVSMRGSQNIRVLINNRPSTITAGSVADALKQIPADMIKSVEVITSPSAKYDAEGSAGIINIITKKNTLQGGSLNIDTGIGLRGTNLGLNGSYKVGKMGFSLGGFGRAGYNAPGSFENTQTSLQGTNVLVTRQSAETRNNMLFGRYSFGWDYDINEKNYVNGSVMYGVRNWNSLQDDLVTQLYQNDVLQSSSLRNVETTDNSGTVDVNLNYTHTFTKPQQELSLLTQYSRNNRTNDFVNQIFGDEQTLDRQLKNINQSYNQESTVQLDYQDPIGDNQMLEVGAKQIMRQVTSDYETFTASGSGPFTKAENASLSNVFNYNQHVSAAYLSYTYTTANKYSIKAGTRYEYTNINADFENSDEAVEIDPYGVLVPSVNLSKTLKSGNSVKLAYNRRIQRPSLQFLNPNVQNANPAFRTVGNPELDPEYTNNLEASYNTYFKSSSLSLTAYMRNTNNSIQAVREQAEDGVLETSYFNIGQEDAYGASIFGSINLARKLTLSGGTDFYYADMTNNVADLTQQASNSGWVANIRAFGNYKLGKGWGLQGFGFYRGRQVQLQGRQAGFGIYSLNIRKEFNEGRGSIGFGAENFFSKNMKMRNELETPTFSQSSTNVMHNMNFKINFSYRIGKMTMDAGPRRRKKSVNNDDLKGGGESSTQGGGTMTGGAPQRSAPQDGGAPAGGKPAGGTPQAGAPGQAARPVQGGGQPQQGKSAKDQTTLADSLQADTNSLHGRWQGTMGSTELVLNLITEGTILKGSVQTPMGQQPITDGVVNGSSFTFNVSAMGNSIQYTGKIEGNKITLRSSSQGQPMEATLLRVQ